MSYDPLECQYLWLQNVLNRDSSGCPINKYFSDIRQERFYTKFIDLSD